MVRKSAKTLGEIIKLKGHGRAILINSGPSNTTSKKYICVNN
jgi:hypothetical protein